MARASTSSVDAREIVAELLAVPPAEFTATRTARVKALKADGDTELAAAVAKLRRPSVTTWAVNAAVRADTAGATALVDAVHALQRPGSTDVREATRDLDSALDALVAAASTALTEIGTKPTADRRAEIRDALRTAALADDTDAFLAARLQDSDAADPDDTLAAALRAGAHGAGRRRSTSSTPASAAARAPAPDLAPLKAAVKAATAARKDADTALRDAERDVRRIERDLADARAAADTARDAADAAATELAARQDELDEARGD
jgi:hypothetical protein